MIQPKQIPTYDAAARRAKGALDTLQAIDTTKLDAEHVAYVRKAIDEVAKLRGVLADAAHEAYIAARKRPRVARTVEDASIEDAVRALSDLTKR